MKTVITSISGKPGLYKLLKQVKTNLIVETIDGSNKRLPVFPTERVTSLSDITMYTDTEDIPLAKVLDSVCKKENAKATSLNWKKASNEELFNYFSEVLPNFDRNRVRSSDIKKLLQWYDILIKAGISEFEKTLIPKKEDETSDNA